MRGRAGMWPRLESSLFLPPQQVLSVNYAIEVSPLEAKGPGLLSSHVLWSLPGVREYQLLAEDVLRKGQL